VLPVQLEVALLRGQLPELLLRPGSVLAARVVEANRISLAGIILDAQLPEGLLAGESLRLRVEEATPERLHLRIVEQPGQQQPPPVLALPLPGGAQARLRVDEQEAGNGPGGGTPSVTLAYESPSLGRLDLRLELPRGGIVATVGAAQGAPAERAEAAAERLRAGLERALSRPATVRVAPRHDPFDAYA
jgi:hypothetical protein